MDPARQSLLLEVMQHLRLEKCQLLLPRPWSEFLVTFRGLEIPILVLAIACGLNRTDEPRPPAF